ncbi:2OG-Fe(II) oxygenase [Pelagibius litoralis]|uniref:2OG-Fe(II) oxygenase n=1 Tax=Pelagibius litoralis TaxID=374515 RepID=A0A967EWW6_9PROT|nr:2OG-Fe(II) oxygenase [Pelagibius litoralis]NIA68733.1 2OG-Fe(II) oxygenase [Pelagibius litoralis]
MASPAADTPHPSPLDLERFAATPLQRQPFDFVIVPGFLQATALPAIEQDFPEITKGGSFPAQSLSFGQRFANLLAELQSPGVTDAFAEKFALDLSGRPTMVTLRGQSRAKDGQIHTDSRSKLVTALIYLNSQWESDGGRLRMLNSPDDLEDYAAEVPPQAGTLVAFRCSEQAYHGHKPFVGQRRSIQLNWLTDETVLKRELKRHSFSAWTKRILGFGA